jgi:hypothetical protein
MFAHLHRRLALHWRVYLARRAEWTAKIDADYHEHHARQLRTLQRVLAERRRRAERHLRMVAAGITPSQFSKE